MTTDEDRAKSREELLQELIETRRSLAELSRFTKGLGPNEPESGSRAKLPLSVLFGLSDVIVLTDREGEFLYICPTVENVLGFSVEEVKSMQRVDRLLGENVLEHSQPDASGDVRNIRQHVLDKQGNERVFLINVRKLSVEDGSILYSCRDITEKAEAEEKLRQSEQRYRLLAENSLLGVYIHQDDRFVYSNRRLQEILGYSAEELGAMKVWEIFPEEIQPEMRSLARAQYKGREQPTSFERQACTRTGETRWLEVSAVATRYERKPAVLGTMADISERKHARQKLENALKEREVLLREIHHRVKNNLAIISSLLSFQTRSPEEMPLSRAFEEVASRIRSMALAHEILIQSENLAVLNVHDYLEKLVAETVSSSGPALSLHMIETSTDNAFLDIDTAVPLGFIITEIVMSIGKHAAASRDERRARIEFHRIEPDRCRLSVSDTGGGIPKDAQVENPVSLSAQLLRIFVEQLRGVIEPEKFDGRYIAITLPYRQENPKGQ